MRKILIDDQLYQLKVRVNDLLEESEKKEYLDTGACLEVLNFAKDVLERVAKQQELPL